MSDTEHKSTKSVDDDWTLMWQQFDRLIQAMPQEQAAVLAAIQTEHPQLFPELEQLLASHHSQSTLLDQQLGADQLNSPHLPTEIGGYHIIRPLGSGGLGDVYQAQKQEDGFTHTVALKLAPTGKYSTVVLDSFNNELQMLLTLNHPHIERLYEGGVSDDNIPYLVVEYIDGQHIDQYCDLHRLDVRQRIRLFLQVCDAVATMHHSLIIHRDIKASNIMVNAQGETKLLDFGLAKLTENTTTAELAEPTISGYMMTLAYASPEQIRGQNITTASDVYSLGMLLYYLLAGQLPYTIKNNDLAAASQQITAITPPIASQHILAGATINQCEATLGKTLSGELDAILAKAIHKEAERRYASAQQLADDLQRYLHHQPIVAKADTVFYRMQKFVQRHVLGVVATTVVMLSLLLLSLLLYNRSNELQQALLATQKEKQRVTQVTDFLIDIFKLSDPLKNQSDIVDVKDLLDYSSTQLQQQFKQEPATQAKLYETLGTVYLNMSDIETAERLLEQARSIPVQLPPSEQLSGLLAQVELQQKKGELQTALSLLTAFEQQHPDLSMPTDVALKTALLKGQLLYETNQLPAATQLLGTASATLNSQQSTLGLTESQLFKAQQLQADINQLLGNVYWKQGQLDQVANHYQLSYDSNLARLGPAHHLTLKSLSALGVLSYTQGNYKQALQQFEQVLNNRTAQLGASHFLTADAHNRLGATHYELGQLDIAESHYHQALAGLADSGLKSSIKYTRVLNNLGLIKRQQKQYHQAQQLFTEALAIQTELLGEQHTDLAAMLNNLGLTAYDQGQFEQALSWFQRAYQILHDANGLNNAWIGFSMNNMGRMYTHLKQPEMARQWIEQALEVRARLLGTNKLLYADSLMAHAHWAYQNGQYELAEQRTRQAIAIREQRLATDDWRLADSRHLLHSIKPADVLQQLSCDARNIKERFGPDHPRTQMTYQRMQGLHVPTCED